MMALTSLLGGCVPVPILPSDRFLITDERIRSIQPGQTTRTDVLLMLADPYSRGEQDTSFVYRWVKGGGGVGGLLGLPGAVAAGHYVTERCHDLAIQFDGAGRVARLKVFEGKALGRSDFGLARGDSSSARGNTHCDPGLADAVESWLKETP